MRTSKTEIHVQRIGHDESKANGNPASRIAASLLLPATMDCIFRCAVPFYADPGQPNGPQVGQKIYLVTGRNVRAPGAYASW